MNSFWIQIQGDNCSCHIEPYFTDLWWKRLLFSGKKLENLTRVSVENCGSRVWTIVSHARESVRMAKTKVLIKSELRCFWPTYLNLLQRMLIINSKLWEFLFSLGILSYLVNLEAPLSLSKNQSIIEMLLPDWPN